MQAQIKINLAPAEFEGVYACELGRILSGLANRILDMGVIESGDKFELVDINESACGSCSVMEGESVS